MSVAGSVAGHGGASMSPRLVCYWPRAIVHVRLSGRGAASPDWASLLPGGEPRNSHEALIDVTHRQRACGGPEAIAGAVGRSLAGRLRGWGVAVGVSGNKPVAHYAASLAAAGAVVAIPPWQMAAALRTVPIAALPDLDPRTRRWLERVGMRRCGEVATRAPAALIRECGTAGRHLWQLCRGYDVDLIDPLDDAAASLVETRVLPPHSDGRRALTTYLYHLARKLAARLRNRDAHAAWLDVGLRYEGAAGGAGDRFALAAEDNDASVFGRLAEEVLRRHWRGEVVTHIALTAGEVRRRSGQLDLFAPPPRPDPARGAAAGA